MGGLFAVAGEGRSFLVPCRGWEVTGLCKRGVSDKDLQRFRGEVGKWRWVLPRLERLFSAQRGEGEVGQGS